MALTFVTNLVYSVFLITQLFTTLLSLLILLYFNLQIPNSSASDFKLTKSAFLAKSDLSAPFAFSLNLLLLHN